MVKVFDETNRKCMVYYRGKVYPINPWNYFPTMSIHQRYRGPDRRTDDIP